MTLGCRKYLSLSGSVLHDQSQLLLGKTLCFPQINSCFFFTRVGEKKTMAPILIIKNAFSTYSSLIIYMVPRIRVFGFQGGLFSLAGPLFPIFVTVLLDSYSLQTKSNATIDTRPFIDEGCNLSRVYSLCVPCAGLDLALEIVMSSLLCLILWLKAMPVGWDFVVYMGTIKGHITLAPPSTTIFAPVM